MSTYTADYMIKCWNDCQMSGCPSHRIEIAFNNTSDSLLYKKDDEIKFSMDIDELSAFVDRLKDMRGAIEIDRIFENIEKGQPND